MKILLVGVKSHLQDKGFHKFLEASGHQFESVPSVQALVKNAGQCPDLLVIDFSFLRTHEEQLLTVLESYYKDLLILLIYRPLEEETVYNFNRPGLYDAVTMNDNFMKNIRIKLSNIEDLIRIRAELKNIKKIVQLKYEASGSIIGECKGMRKVREQIEKAIDLKNIPVSIYGEKGTGRELVAKTIHFNSGRRDYPFFSVNLGAIPDEFVESELFGHERSTEAKSFSRVLGKIEEARGGTVYINDIAELEFNLQRKLLKVIQESQIRRGDGTEDIQVNTRMIVSTSRDLATEVKKGSFREDLYYSLMRISIPVPPLSERGSDIILLANHFLKKYCEENNLDRKDFSPAARRKLLSHNYPDNVSELNSIVELAAVLSAGPIIEEDQILFSQNRRGEDFFNTEMPLKEYEKRIIRTFLDRYNNNVVMAARKLGIGKSKIYNMLKEGKL